MSNCENPSDGDNTKPVIVERKPKQDWKQAFLQMLPTDNVKVGTMSMNGRALSSVMQTIGVYGSAPARGNKYVPLKSGLILMIDDSKPMADVLLKLNCEIGKMLKQKEGSLLDLWVIVLSAELKIYHYQIKQRGFSFTSCIKPVDSLIKALSHKYYPLQEAENLCNKETISFEAILQDFSGNRIGFSEDLLKLGKKLSDLGNKIMLFSDQDMSVEENYANCVKLMKYCARIANVSRPEGWLYLVNKQKYLEFVEEAKYSSHVAVLEDWEEVKENGVLLDNI